MSEKKRVVEWLRTHKYFKITSMCEELGTDPGNFYKAYRAGRITDKLLPEVVEIISQYGFKAPETKPQTENKPEKAKTQPQSSSWEDRLIRRERK